MTVKAGTQVIDGAWRFLKERIVLNQRCKMGTARLRAKVRSAQYEYWHRNEDLWLCTGELCTWQMKNSSCQPNDSYHALRLPPEKKVPAASGFAMHHLALQYIDRCSYLHIPGTTTGLDLCSLFQPNALEGPVPNLITKCRECPNKAVHKLHTSPATTTATGPNLCILSNHMLVHDLSHVWQPNVGNVQMLPCVSQFGINQKFYNSPGHCEVSACLGCLVESFSSRYIQTCLSHWLSMKKNHKHKESIMFFFTDAKLHT